MINPSATLAAALIWWMPGWTHPHHHHPAPQHKFVSHYCQTAASPYVGGPTSKVCCKWHSAYANIPDGYGTWDCTITAEPVAAKS